MSCSDQGGECDLQDQSMFYGIDKSRFKENKRHVPEKYMGPLIKTQMTRCIHCTRCIRFATEVAGVPELGAIGRGEDMQITTYLEKAMESELSANVIDLCPVGALTSKPYVFEARPWELKKTETIDVMDAVGSNIRVDTYGWEVKRVLPKVNDDINEEWISDKTRYACDGLKNQRLDNPFIKNNGQFQKTSWEDVYSLIKLKINQTTPDKISGFTGDLTNMETQFAAREFFDKILTSNYLESRSENIFVDTSKRENYIFNSSINSIEESDFILLVGTNPRYEATILNSRIRKSYLNNRAEIYSFGDQGDLTYPYKVINESNKALDNFLSGKGDLYNKFKNSSKPMVILGFSFFLGKSAKYFQEKLNSFQKNYINEEFKDWKIINVLSKDASTVGAFDLDIINTSDGYNKTLEKLNNNEFELIFLFGQDNLNFSKKNEFVVYIGSHGDKGAETADIVLPSPAYTEQNGYYTNLEGKIQKAYKATYPPGSAKEEWLILNELSKLIRNKVLFKDRNYLEDSLKNYLNTKKKYTLQSSENNNFIEEQIKTIQIDYFYSNVIARASKTMSECRNLRLNFKSTGTEG